MSCSVLIFLFRILVILVAILVSLAYHVLRDACCESNQTKRYGLLACSNCVLPTAGPKGVGSEVDEGGFAESGHSSVVQVINIGSFERAFLKNREKIFLPIHTSPIDSNVNYYLLLLLFKCCHARKLAWLFRLLFGAVRISWQFLRSMKCVNFKSYIFKCVCLRCSIMWTLRCMLLGYMISESYVQHMWRCENWEMPYRWRSVN